MLFQKDLMNGTFGLLFVHYFLMFIKLGVFIKV